MSGGQQHWNEDTQRWEAGPGTDTPPTPPPPSGPDHAPTAAWPPAGPRMPAAPPAPKWPPAAPAEATGGPAAPWPPADRRTPPAPAGSPSSADPPPTEPPAESPAEPPASTGPSAPAGPPAGARPPAESPASAGPCAGPPTGTGPSAPTWPPAGRRTPPPSSWPPAETSAHAEPPTVSWPPAEPAAVWPPAESPAPTATWPPTAATAASPAADPAPPRGGPSRRVLWSVLVGAAAAGIAVSLVLALVVRENGDDRSRRGQAHTSSAPVTRGPSPVSSSPAPSPSAATPPAGYELHDDGEGFRVAVPEGWARATVPSEYGMAVVNYRSPDRERRLQVYEVSEASPQASFDLYLSDRTAKPRGFEKLALADLDEGDFTGSRLEYLADTIRGEPEVGTWHVYDERFVAADGRIYALAAYGPDADGRDDELELLTTALAWFCPPGMDCDPAGNAALN
ncbi:hypothetical protein [Streptomyces sp. NPDC001781]